MCNSTEPIFREFLMSVPSCSFFLVLIFALWSLSNGWNWFAGTAWFGTVWSGVAVALNLLAHLLLVMYHPILTCNDCDVIACAVTRRWNLRVRACSNLKGLTTSQNVWFDPSGDGKTMNYSDNVERSRCYTNSICIFKLHLKVAKTGMLHHLVEEPWYWGRSHLRCCT